MRVIYNAVITILAISVICMVIDYISPNSSMRKSINIVVGIVHIIVVMEAILQLFG